VTAVSGSSSLSEVDLRHMLSLVERAVPADDHEVFYSSVLAGLQSLVPCDDISFALLDVRRRTTRGVMVTAAGVTHDLAFPDPDLDARFWDAFWKEGGCNYPAEQGDYVTVLRRSDRYGDLAYRRTAMGAVMAEAGTRHEVLVPLPPQGLVERRLLLFRNDGIDFSERDLLLLRVFRPHLAELYLRRSRDLSGQPDLTPRQWEILRRVSSGASNAQVGRALGVSEATVRKHLENVFVRLQVASRTEAVDRVRPFMDVA
jgi:DNA-binding CsgD family transcriptional regulator